jgi:hypothetical protein
VLPYKAMERRSQREELLSDLWHVLDQLLVDDAATDADADAVPRLESELRAARALAADERAMCEKYQRMNHALTEDALASRQERAFDAEEAGALRAQLAESEARAAKAKLQVSALRDEIGKVADATQAMVDALSPHAAPCKTKELAALARKLGRRPRDGATARVWQLTSELAALIASSRTSAVDAARVELEAARAELEAALSPKREEKLKHVAESALAALRESRAECALRAGSEARWQSLCTTVQAEYKRVLHTTRVTVKLASTDASALCDAERGAIRVALDLLMAPDLDASGLVAALLLATCPVSAVAVFRTAGCRASAAALRELCVDSSTARARVVYVQALHIYASQIGGDVAHKAVQTACLMSPDPLVAATVRLGTATLTQYDMRARSHELVRALLVVRLVASVRPIQHDDARLLVVGT